MDYISCITEWAVIVAHNTARQKYERVSFYISGLYSDFISITNQKKHRKKIKRKKSKFNRWYVPAIKVAHVSSTNRKIKEKINVFFFVTFIGE